jgi:VIT1/CCC1 family predicted Fe2+/Mn2+ transporter
MGEVLIVARPLQMKMKNTTRLGRAVRAAVDGGRDRPMIGKEKHSTNTSFGSDRDFYLAERNREQTEIEAQPDDEREEIREIYAAKGFKGQLLEDVVFTITSNRETWVNTMMNEELHLQPIAQRSLLQSAVIVTVATLIGHLIPIVPFMVVARTPAIITAIALSAVTLFAVGVYSAKTLVGDWRKSGIQMVAIGLGAAALGFFIGRLFHSIGG